MKRTAPVAPDRLLFRLDFALRGHSAYSDPACLESLVGLIESATRRFGAPLLRYVQDEPRGSPSNRPRKARIMVP